MQLLPPSSPIAEIHQPTNKLKISMLVLARESLAIITARQQHLIVLIN